MRVIVTGATSFIAERPVREKSCLAGRPSEVFAVVRPDSQGCRPSSTTEWGLRYLCGSRGKDRRRDRWKSGDRQ